MADLEESHDDGVVTLTLNRPERLNSFSDAMLRALIEALERLGADPAVGAIVLTGAGRAFCAGGDVKEMASRAETTFEERVEALRWKHAVPQMLKSCPRPVIAMLNGHAFGAGLGLALACDLRIAAEGARFGTAFAGVGFSGDFGTSYTLTQVVGPAKARELLLLGEAFDTTRALAIGLLYRVVPPADLLAETMALARRLAAGPRIAHGYMKRNLLAAESGSLAQVLELEAMHQIRTAQTEDHAEAKRAFTEKRAPVFRGT